MKQAIKREIVAWRIFHTHNTFNNIVIVLFRTMNGQLRATIGLSDSFNKVSALQIANNGERLLFEEACPFFKHLVEENLRVSQVQIGSQAKGSRGGLCMRVYWRKVRWGQNLILSDEEGHEQELGGFRETKRGIDALVKTFGYDPSHSRKGFQTIEEAKAFVESFRPWELYGAQDVTVESEVMPALDSASAGTTVAPEQSAKSMVPELQPTKRWWEFWKKT